MKQSLLVPDEICHTHIQRTFRALLSYSLSGSCQSQPQAYKAEKLYRVAFLKEAIWLSKMFTNCHVLMRWRHYLSSKSDNVQGMMVMSDGLPDANRDPNSNNITFAVLTRLLF